MFLMGFAGLCGTLSSSVPFPVLSYFSTIFSYSPRSHFVIDITVCLFILFQVENEEKNSTTQANPAKPGVFWKAESESVL